MTSASLPVATGKPPYVAAAIASVVVLALYVLTLAPTTAMWDTSEYIAAAYRMSLPHPPGNPLFILIGRVFTLLPIAPTIAERVNLLAAITSALSAGLWFLVTERILRTWVEDHWQRLLGAALATLIGATAFTVWNQSVVNEKVYTISLLGLAVISWLTFRWLDSPDGFRADRILILIAYLLGLGYANHMAGFLAAPAVAAAVLVRRPATLVRWKLILVAIVALLFGMTPFATQPIRSAYHPPLNTGEPTGCLERLEASCLFSGETVDRFIPNFNRDQYRKPPLSERQAPITAQVGMWWEYFKWQWLRDSDRDSARLQRVLAVIFLALGLYGGWVHYRRDRMTFWYFGPLILTVTLVLIYYMNFKLGWTQGERLGVNDFDFREVRDRDYFYLWSFSAWGIWAGVGLLALWRELGQGLESLVGGATQARRRALLAASPVLLLALIPLAGNYDDASRRGETFTREWARDLLNSVEPYGVLITNGDNDTFPLWYAQDVEGIRQDVTVAVTSLLATDWYVRQIIRRPLYDYDESAGPAIYRGMASRKPGPPLSLTIAEADQIPPYVQLREPQVFRKDSLIARIEPGFLTRDQLMILRFIRDSFPERPLYLATPVIAGPLGLSPYVVAQGLAYKVMPRAVRPEDGYLRSPVGWMDVARTRALWDTVYRAQEAAISRGKWVDRASSNMPMAYLVTGAYLAEGLYRTGDSTKATAVMDTVMAIARATDLESLFGPAQ
ncbi:MAG TPA: DUF2723 domain-containing protein [Gemmatimonadaceae bacterium]|nr:DUF2723 domain-containing protein [Gemmatimonadaceae bacterium]